MKIDNIREYKSKDLDNIMEIWVNTNIEAHNFIDENYWRNNFDMVKEKNINQKIWII